MRKVYPSPFCRVRDGLSFKKKSGLNRLKNDTATRRDRYIYIGRAVFSTRTLRISAHGETGRKFKKSNLKRRIDSFVDSELVQHAHICGLFLNHFLRGESSCHTRDITQAPERTSYLSGKGFTTRSELTLLPINITPMPLAQRHHTDDIRFVHQAHNTALSRDLGKALAIHIQIIVKTRVIRRKGFSHRPFNH